MNLRITQKHILHGSRCSATRCPTALSLQELVDEILPAANYIVYVDTTGMSIINCDSRILLRIPMDADMSMWIRAFDAGKEVHPDTFQIPLTEAWYEEDK